MEHKVRSLTSASIIFVSLLLPLRLPDYFWQIHMTTVVLAALLTFWVFGEKPSLKRLKEDWFTIVFIGLFVFVTGLFGYLMTNTLVQALILGACGVSIYFSYQVGSRLKRNYKPSLILRNIITLSSILGVFFAVSDVLRWQLVYNNRPVQILAVILSFLAVFVISEFLFEAQGVEASVLYSLVFSFVAAQIVWLSSFWLISYPQSTRITNIGVPLPAILVTVYFYLFWGLAHHRLEETLTRKIILEYLVIAVSFIAILLVTAQWLPS